MDIQPVENDVIGAFLEERNPSMNDEMLAQGSALFQQKYGRPPRDNATDLETIMNLIDQQNVSPEQLDILKSMGL